MSGRGVRTLPSNGGTFGDGANMELEVSHRRFRLSEWARGQRLIQGWCGYMYPERRPTLPDFAEPLMPSLSGDIGPALADSRAN